MSADEGEPDASEAAEDEGTFSVDDLVNAAREGRLEDVEILLSEYAVEVNGYPEKPRKWTALGFACLNGHTDVAKLLIENGANVNQKNHPEEGTAIHMACRSGKVDLVDLLLDNGASIEADSEWGLPIHIASLGGHKELVDYLLDRGASLEDPDRNGNTPLMYAVFSRNKNMVLKLLERGASIDHGSKPNRTPLHSACRTGRSDMVEVLLAHGAEKNLQGDFSVFSPLYEACQWSYYEIVRMLLNHGVRLDGYDDRGHTPLHNVILSYVCSTTYVPDLRNTNRGCTLKLLLEHGIDANIVDREGFTPFERLRDHPFAMVMVTKHEMSVMLDYGAGSGVICRAECCEKKQIKHTILTCIYSFYRTQTQLSLQQDLDHEFLDVVKGIVSTYEKHFIKSELAGLYHGDGEKAAEPTVFGVDWDPAARQAFRLECESELCRMKTDFVDDTAATYFALLSRDLPALRRRGLFGKLTSDSCAERYPIFANMIFSGYVKFRRIFLEEKCSEFFSITRPPLLPECAEIVMSRLSEPDLMNLLEVYRTYMQFREKQRELRNRKTARELKERKTK